MLNFDLSSTQQIALLAIQLGIIIFAAKFCGDLVKKMKMPSVLGELAAGIVIGPYLLGGIKLPFHGCEHGLFGFLPEIVSKGGEVLMSNMTFSSYHTSLYALATVGSILLLFMSGMETDLQMFFRYSVVGTVVGIGGVIFSFAFGGFVGMMALHTGFADPRCMFLGILCTATSVGITARILSEKKKVDSPEGVTILAAAVIDDVLGIICLAIVMGIVGTMTSGDPNAGVNWTQIGLTSAKCVGIWLGATALGLFLARSVAKFLHIFKSPVIFANLAFGIALIVSGLFEQAGLAMIIGAYVTGLSLSKTDIAFALQQALTPVYNFLVPIFFVVMGMLVDIRVFADPETLKLGVIYSLLAILAKIIGCALPALFMNFNWLGALRIGTGMVPRGEVALIIASIGTTTMMTINGKPVPIMDAKLFGVAIIMTLATTILAPPLLTVVLSIKGKGVKKETHDDTIVHTPFEFPSPTIAEFVTQHMMETFDHEGFMMSTLDSDSGVLQLRRDKQSLTVICGETSIVFETKQVEVPLVNTIMYETIVDLHQAMQKLHDLTSPAKVIKNIIDKTDETKRELSSQALESALVINREHIICRECIKLDLEATTKEGVICELVNLIAKNHPDIVTDPTLCCNDILEREKVITTCMQNGVAIPHARTNGVTTLIAAIGIKKSGFDFDAMDGRPTKVFILCLSPKDAQGPHIQFIASVASRITTQEKLNNLLALNDVEDIYKFFTAKK